MMRRLKGVMLKRMHSMITCVEFESFVLEYLDNTLPDHQRKIFELHMRLCRECREYLAAYQRSMEIGQSFLGPADGELPTDVPEDLIRAILSANEG